MIGRPGEVPLARQASRPSYWPYQPHGSGGAVTEPLLRLSPIEKKKRPRRRLVSSRPLLEGWQRIPHSLNHGLARWALLYGSVRVTESARRSAAGPRRDAAWPQPRPRPPLRPSPRSLALALASVARLSNEIRSTLLVDVTCRRGEARATPKGRGVRKYCTVPRPP